MTRGSSAAGDAPFRTLRGTVLLVDDDPACLALLSRELLGSDFRVVRALGSAAGLADLERAPVDVIVTELELRGMGGLELLDRARARRPEAVRIILTGQPDLASLLSAINCEEVFRYLTKPVGRDRLLATLQLALARSRAAPPEAAEAAPAAARRFPALRRPLALEEVAALREACRDLGSAAPRPLLLTGSST